MSHFLEAAVGSRATPLIVLDGPPAEIRRHLAKVMNMPWINGYYPLEYTYGFGLCPLKEPDPAHAKYAPAETYEGAPDEMLNWLRNTTEKARKSFVQDEDGNEMNERCDILLVIYDAHIFKEEHLLASQLTVLTDPEGPLAYTSSTIIMAGPGIINDLPAVLRDQSVKIRVPYPDESEVKALVVDLYQTAGLEAPDDDSLERVAREATGMASAQVSNMTVRSLYEHGKVDPKVVRQEIEQLLEDLPGVTLINTDGWNIDSIAGYDAAKNTMLSLIKAYETKPLADPKGIVANGPPGTGKTALTRAVCGEVGWKALLVSASEFKDKFVGETGKNMSRFITLAEAIAPCAIILDEVDGAFGSSDGSKESDSAGDMLSIFLTWQAQPREKPVFVVATCNRLDKLPPEFSRDGRFDARFFMDVPTRKTKDAIWKLYMEKFNLQGSAPIALDDDWTGAEIEACCRNAYINDEPLEVAGSKIVPVVSRMGSGFLHHLRTIAAAACLDAETGVPYKRILAAASPDGLVTPPDPPTAPFKGGKKTIELKGGE